MNQENVTEKQNTQFIFNKIFQNCDVFEIERKECGRARQTTDDNIMQHKKYAIFISVY
jgi:hypothetical protein